MIIKKKEQNNCNNSNNKNKIPKLISGLSSKLISEASSLTEEAGELVDPNIFEISF